MVDPAPGGLGMLFPQLFADGGGEGFHGGEDFAVRLEVSLSEVDLGEDVDELIGIVGRDGCGSVPKP